MGLNKKTVYMLLLFASGLLYFLYSLSNSMDGDFYRLGPRLKRANLSSLPSHLHRFFNPPQEVKLINNTTWAADRSFVNISSTSAEPPGAGAAKAELLQSAVQVPVVPATLPTSDKKPLSRNVDKSQDVIQRIAPKYDNKTMDYIVQGVVTSTLYDSGFILPSVEICPDFGKDLQVAVIVTSAPKHEAARMAIRQTWGHYHQRSDIAIAFLLGRTPPQDQAAIVKEAATYNDIIQANFIDSYNNLTLKTISMLEWVDNYCHKVKFVLKTDDDMFINVPKLLTFLSKHVKDKKKIYGRLAKKWKPIRNKSSKYYVSIQQYKNPIFPDFTTGPAYAFTSDILHDLYEAALSKTYLKLEDVYTTGIVAQDLKIQRVHVNEFFNRRVSLNACNVQKGISIHMVKSFEQYDLWKKLLDGRSKCSK